MTKKKKCSQLFFYLLNLKVMIEQKENFHYQIDFKKIVCDYFNKFSKLSMNAFAQRSGVPVSTLRRVIKSDKAIDVAPHIVLNLLSYIYKEKNMTKLIEKTPESLSLFLTKYFGNFIFENHNYKLDTDLNIQLQDSLKYFIYKLASNSSGVTLDEILSLYGSEGRVKVNEMATAGFITYELGVFHAKEKNFSLDLETMAKHLPELVSKYRPEKLTSGRNLCYSLSESLNVETIQKVKDIERVAVKKIIEMINKPSNQGNIPYFTLVLSDQLHYLEKEGELQ